MHIVNTNQRSWSPISHISVALLDKGNHLQTTWKTLTELASVTLIKIFRCDTIHFEQRIYKLLSKDVLEKGSTFVHADALYTYDEYVCNEFNVKIYDDTESSCHITMKLILLHQN